MGAIVRNVVNDQLLRLSYKDPKNIKRFLRNWGGLEGLSEKGDTVATCILTDLKTVTAIDLDKYHKSDRAEFNKAYRKGKLSHYQYMSIAYVLVLGYTLWSPSPLSKPPPSSIRFLTFFSPPSFPFYHCTYIFIFLTLSFASPPPHLSLRFFPLPAPITSTSISHPLSPISTHTHICPTRPSAIHTTSTSHTDPLTTHPITHPSSYTIS